MPPIVPLVLWASALLAASSLLALTSNSTTGTSANHRVYNACTIIPNGTYYSDISAANTSAEKHLYDYCHFYHMSLGTSFLGMAPKVNRCCRVCCNITVTLGRTGRHYLFDQKAPFGFPCGPDKICDRDQACIKKPNETIEIEKTTTRKHDILVKETFWYSVHS
uniref:Putative salivary secreted peptide n=1 Tax=Ixodes pacificus TaxID=29930 RepID=Q6B8H2_IXOPA|nr:putative salivary secreted peptide [Ixodes pacificus]